MTSKEYEQHVTNLVRQLDFCKGATISNNCKFPGKRQPGEYEIDIAVEVRHHRRSRWLDERCRLKDG